MAREGSSVPPGDDSDGVAIIGMAGRFPGAENLEQFWGNVRNGVESISTLSEEALRQAGVPSADLSDPRYVRAAPLLAGADLFDAAFFSYSTREAQLTDPQQRVFLECAWEALENAGYDPQNMPCPVGVFGGAGGLLSSYFFSQLAKNESLIGKTGSLSHIANGNEFLTTRVSYKLNLRGPSMNVQTACSTSLVAVHLACQSILARECDVALAGGVTVRVPLEAGYFFEEGGIISPDGHCRAFDAGAHGTVFGNGVGLVVLKRLGDALADGDLIRAVIKGSAVNNDGGAKLSYTAASEAGQAVAIARALAAAKCAPETVTLVEAHGTATAMGDPVEVAALEKAFRVSDQRIGGCALGSVKSNIGHAEAAAGVAGLIKTVFALQHRKLPPTLHFSTPNPRIDFARSPFYVNTTLRDWPDAATPRRAGINSLGFGGTNAFVVLEEAPPQPAVQQKPRPFQLLCLSTRSATSLDRLAQDHARYFEDLPERPLGDVCYTAAVGRTAFTERLAIVGDSSDAMRRQLQQTREAEPLRGHLASSALLDFAFVFSDSSTAVAKIGSELFDTEPVFREAFERCRTLFQDQSGGSDAAVQQNAATFALQYALAELWRSWGITPSAVAGVGSGEYAAACVAGVLSLEAAATLLTARAQLLRSHPEPAARTRYEKTAAAIEFGLPRIRMIGRDAQSPTVSNASYWIQNLSPATTLAHAVQELGKQGCRVMVEIGTGLTPPSLDVVWLRSLAEGESDGRQMLTSLGALWVRGANVDWSGFYGGRAPRRTHLPTYPFERKRYWIDRNEGGLRGFTADTPGHLREAGSAPFYGHRLASPLPAIQFETQLGAPVWPALGDHRIYGEIIVPGAWHLAMILAAARQTFGTGTIVLRDVLFPRALALGAREVRTAHLLFHKSGDETLFEIWSRLPTHEDPHASWLLHAQGTVSVEPATAPGLGPLTNARSIASRCPETILVAEFYQRMRDRQISLGPAFQWNARVSSSDTETISRIFPPGTPTDGFLLHPGLLDSLVQIVIARLPPTYLPLSIERLSFSHQSTAPAWIYARLHPATTPDPEIYTADVQLADTTGKTTVEITGFAVKRATRSAVFHEHPEKPRRETSSRLRIPKRGMFSDLQIQPMDRHAPGPGEVEIGVHAAGLNFRDVLNALGKYPGDPGELGLECAGEITAVGPDVERLQVGDEVVAVAFGCFSSHVTTPAQLVAPKPPRLTMEDAATIPVAFLTVHYAFEYLTRLRAGQRVLIHAATGGVGLAAIQLAQRAGAEIFATASSPEKHAHLRALGVRHIFNSRNLNFAAEIQAQTGGAGVDVVLNSLSGEFIPAGLSTLATGGHFIELSKIGIWDAKRVAALRPDVTYSTVALDTMFTEQPGLIAEMLEELLADFALGALAPLPQRVFPLAKAADAFHLMAAAKHIGKIVLSLTSGPVAEPASTPPAHIAPVFAVDTRPPEVRVREEVLAQIQHALKLDPTEPLDPEMALTDLGLDSLLAVEIINALAKSTGHRVPITLFFVEPTLNAITEELVNAIREQEGPAKR